MSTTRKRRNPVSRHFMGLRNKIMTYAQVRYPVIAGKVVQSITSKGSSTKGASAPGTTVVVAEPEGRYNPQGNGRTDGIVAAQAAAAPLPQAQV